jgi:membrane-associated protein
MRTGPPDPTSAGPPATRAAAADPQPGDAPPADPESSDSPAADARPAATPAREPHPLEDERLPWEGPPRRADLACLFLISASGLFYMLLTPAIPSLIGTNPVLLALLTGSTPSTVTAGAFAAVGEASVPLAILAGTFGQMKFDILYWWAGRLWGRRAAHWIAGRGERATRAIRRLEWLTSRFGWLAVVVIYFLYVVPKGLIFAAAGWTGMRLPTFLTLSVIGALGKISLNVTLGYMIGQPAVTVAETISRYALVSSIVLVVLVVGYQLWRGRRDNGAILRPR